MSILTGLQKPTSGSVYINGLNSSTNMTKIRKSFGFCPQQNMLFDKMTVLEHLVFFGMLKGLSSKQSTEEGYELLQTLKIVDKRNALSVNLSGGQKRKLSLACALIGGSKIIFLDEPTRSVYISK